MKPARAKRLADFADLFRHNVTEGNILGVAAVVLLPRRRFLLEVLGEAERDPVFTRGAIQSLDDVLASAAGENIDPPETIF